MLGEILNLFPVKVDKFSLLHIFTTSDLSVFLAKEVVLNSQQV